MRVHIIHHPLPVELFNKQNEIIRELRNHNVCEAANAGIDPNNKKVILISILNDEYLIETAFLIGQVINQIQSKYYNKSKIK